MAGKDTQRLRRCRPLRRRRGRAVRRPDRCDGAVRSELPDRGLARGLRRSDSQRRGAKSTLFCFSTLVNDVNELLVRADRVASGAGRERESSPMRAVYHRLVGAKALSARLGDDLLVINRARNRMTHAYGRLSADDVHSVIRIYVDRVHDDLWRGLARWLGARGVHLA